MSRLERSPPLSRDNVPTAHSNALVALRQDVFFGVAKLIVGKIEPAQTAEIQSLLGTSLADKPNTVAHGDDLDIAWIAPHQWLLLGDETQIKKKCAAAKTLLAKDTALVVELTHARAVFQLSKPGARDVLASLCPLDLHARAFAPGRCASSLLGETGVFIQQCDDAPTFRVIVDQSYADYAWRLLSDACKSVAHRCYGG